MDLDMTQVVEDAGSSDEADSQDEEHSATLEVQTSADPPVLQTFHIKKRGPSVLGRSSSCDICLDNKVVSQKHISIELRKDCLFIEDLGSRNKTKIGKERLVPNVKYRLGYKEEFCIGGLGARVLRERSHDGVDDDDSDTCSESLLPREEEDAGTVLHGGVVTEGSPNSEASTVAYASPNQDSGTSSKHPTVQTSSSAKAVSAATEEDGDTDVDEDPFKVSKAPEERKDTVENAENEPQFSSQSDFTPPPMPDLNFTQQEKEKVNAEKNKEDSRKATTQDLEAETQLLPLAEDDPKDAVKEEMNTSMEFRCAPTQALDEILAEDGEDADFRCAPTQVLPEIEAGLSRRFYVQDAETEQNFEDTVLCEATQGDRRVDSEEEDDLYCGETQEISPKVFRREEEAAASPPRGIVEETPPGSPGVVPESDEEQLSTSENLAALNVEKKEEDGLNMQEGEATEPVVDVTGQSLNITVVERKEAECTTQKRSSVDSEAETQALVGVAGASPSCEREEKMFEEAETQPLEAKKSDDDDIAVGGGGVEVENPRINSEENVERKDETAEGAKTSENAASNRKEGYEEEVVMPESEKDEQEDANSKVAQEEAGGSTDASRNEREMSGSKEEGTVEQNSKEAGKEEAVEDAENADGVESKETKAKETKKTGRRSKRQPAKVADPAKSGKEASKARRSSMRKNAGKKMGDILSAEKGAWLIENSQGTNQLSDNPSESPSKTSGRAASSDVSENEANGIQQMASAASPSVTRPDSSESEDSAPVLVYAGCPLAESCATQDLPSFSQLLKQSEEKQKENERPASRASDSVGLMQIDANTKSEEDSSAWKVQGEKAQEEEGDDSDAEFVTKGKRARKSVRKVKPSSQRERGRRSCKTSTAEESTTSSQHSSRKSSQKEEETDVAEPESEQTERISDQPEQGKADETEGPPSSTDRIEKHGRESRRSQKGKRKVQEKETPAKGANAVALDSRKENVHRAGGRRSQQATMSPSTKGSDSPSNENDEGKQSAPQRSQDDTEDFELTPSKRWRTNTTPKQTKIAAREKSTEPLQDQVESVSQTESSQRTRRSTRTVSGITESRRQDTAAKEQFTEGSSNDVITRRGRKHLLGSSHVVEAVDDKMSEEPSEDLSRTPSRRQRHNSPGAAGTPVRKRQSKAKNVAEDNEEMSPKKRQKRKEEEREEADDRVSEQDTLKQALSAEPASKSETPRRQGTRSSKVVKPELGIRNSRRHKKPDDAVEEIVDDLEPVARVHESNSEKGVNNDVDEQSGRARPRSTRNTRKSVEVGDLKDGKAVEKGTRNLRGKRGASAIEGSVEAEVSETEATEESKSSQKSQTMKTGPSTPQIRPSPRTRNSRGRKEVTEDRSETIAEVRKSRRKRETSAEEDAENHPRQSRMKRSVKKEESEEEEAGSKTPVKSGRRKARGHKDSSRERGAVEEASSAKSRRASSSSGSRTRNTKPRVLFTGLEHNKGQEIVESLGGVVAETVSNCTHLVTDKFRRTVKALCCIAMGVPIVSIQWLNKCKASGSFVDHAPYLLRDKTAEKNFEFDLETTMRLAGERRLLRDWSVHVTSHVKPAPEDMKEILTCAGAKYLPKMPQRLSEKLVVVSCQEDKKAYSTAAKKAIPVVSAEFVLTGLLQYKIDTEKYAL